LIESAEIIAAKHGTGAGETTNFIKPKPGIGNSRYQNVQLN
jgi:hypothetical protein